MDLSSNFDGRSYMTIQTYHEYVQLLVSSFDRINGNVSIRKINVMDGWEKYSSYFMIVTTIMLQHFCEYE